jgi:hypothetical protein
MADNSVTETIFFPIRQADRASQAQAGSLLARSVFRALRRLIDDRLDDAKQSMSSETVHRHAAILVDGKRGTGKSSVLTNLSTYLASADASLLKRVHVLKPIDPTLLEDSDNLFLNIVAAAILADRDVKSAMAHDSEARTTVYKRLQHLGHALENVQTQRDKKGLDKIRAFIGNQELIEEVHQFFKAVLSLLKKDLLVLPIDDVDTSLHRAFENLEVVRRYLTSPLVLPVISGDSGLYQDVTWRDFHGRLLEDSKSQRLAALQRAQELATEYHRKVLPLQYRLSMPTMQEYFRRENIVLGDRADGKLTFPHFHAWLEALLNDRTNGFENSYLPVPIRTIRAFGQLVYRLRDSIPALEQAISAGNLSKEMLRHYLVMPDLPAQAIQAFKNIYQSSEATAEDKTRRNSRDAAYSEFARSYVTDDPQPVYKSPLADIPVAEWIAVLRQQFAYDADAGAAYLVLTAYEDWRGLKGASGDKWNSVFDTPLFQPQFQAQDHSEFHAVHELSDWRNRLEANNLSEKWLSRLPDRTILPYPVPEIGKPISAAVMKAYVGEDIASTRRLLPELLLHRNFYQSNKTSVLLSVGRIFEIVITSLVRDMTAADMSTILNRAPFYSFGAMAQTKTVETYASDDDELSDESTAPIELKAELSQFAEAINAWRKDSKLEDLRLSPWLVYNVMNKFFNQAWLFNDPKKLFPAADVSQHIAWVGRKAFNSIWAAFGSFEKGQLYGMPPIIASVNIGEGQDFQNSDLYRQNITPFVGKTSKAGQFGLRVGAITAMLESHPLKQLTDLLQRPPTQTVPEPQRGARLTDGLPSKNPTRSEWLFANTTKKQFEAAARQMLNWSEKDIDKALRDYDKLFKDTRLLDAINRVFRK